jgi:hypothetical protein
MPGGVYIETDVSHLTVDLEQHDSREKELYSAPTLNQQNPPIVALINTDVSHVTVDLQELDTRGKEKYPSITLCDPEKSSIVQML